MTKCTNCGNKWTTKEKIKKAITFSQAMTCPYCGADQFLSPKYRKKSALFTLAMSLAFFIPAFFDIPWHIHISIMILAIIINIILQAQTIELHDKEEYPF